jgi:excinuclease ABC subunit C
MVVFVEGRPKKSDYRHFNIQSVQGPDDFASMQETLRRRLRYLRKDADRPPIGEADAATAAIEAQARKRERFHEKPDLILIDGGKGQLNAVVEVMHEMDMWGIPVAGLAKEHEWLYLPGQSEPVILPPNTPGLHLVMRVRDEAHRFAITGHRRRRAKRHSQSILETIPGLGPVKRRELLKQFGGMQGILRAGVDDFVQIRGLGRELAEAIYEHLHPGK